jgi:hypothetical protein
MAMKNAKESALTTPAETVKREEPPEDSQRRQRRILWVDDRPENNVLERRGKHTVSLLSWRDRLERLSQNIKGKI